MNWLDEKYINLLSYKFHTFKHKGNHLYNVDCLYCMEHETSSKKRSARGYFIDEGDHFRYYCHRCTKAVPKFEYFLKEHDYTLYKDYILEKLKDLGVKQPKFKLSKDIKTLVNNPLSKLKKISDLPDDHFAKQYVNLRKIPDNVDLYFAENFKAWVNSQFPNKFEKTAKDHPRLIIPFFTKNHTLHAYQGRAFGNEDPKYLTIVTDERYPSLYGLESYNPTIEAFVTEGPIDAMFVDNCLASAGGNIFSKLEGLNKDKLTLIYDNEKRSIHTIKKMYTAIKNGYKIVVWPDDFKYKDINAAIQNNVSKDNIKYILETNTYSDLKAYLALANWSKVKESQ
jgi:DNA primase